MDVKKPVFARLDEVMKPGALLFSNTSALDIDQLAAMTKRPQDVAGTHFFSPANVMKLLEVVRGSAVVAARRWLTAMQMGRKIGKISAMAGNTDGFVANRSRAPFNTEMVILLEEGCLPEQVDKVMVDFGYPMGPFAVGDLAGLDIGARRPQAPRRGRTRTTASCRSPTGWWRWAATGRRPAPAGIATRRATARRIPIPRSPRIIKEVARRAGRAAARVHRPGDPAPAAVLLGERGVPILEEGKAYRASDIDVMWLHGFGFPRYRGGLMFWADGIGVREVYNQIAAWHQQYGERWAPSRLLRELAKSGTPFREAKAAAFVP